MKTLAGYLSSIRESVKAKKQDAFLTDRTIFSKIVKHLGWMLNREDAKFKIMQFTPSFQRTLVEMGEIDAAEVPCCFTDEGLPFETGTRLWRSVNELPDMFDGYYGPMVASVSSLDGSLQLSPIREKSFARLRSQALKKYIKDTFFWVRGKRLYATREILAVWVSGFFIDQIPEACGDTKPDCRLRQDRPFFIPPRIVGELEKFVVADLIGQASLNIDSNEDGKHPMRA